MDKTIMTSGLCPEFIHFLDSNRKGVVIGFPIVRNNETPMPELQFCIQHYSNVSPA